MEGSDYILTATRLIFITPILYDYILYDDVTRLTAAETRLKKVQTDLFSAQGNNIGEDGCVDIDVGDDCLSNVIITIYRHLSLLSSISSNIIASYIVLCWYWYWYWASLTVIITHHHHQVSYQISSPHILSCL